MNDPWLSNTYLVADEQGSQAALIDAGGPVAPLLAVIDRMRFELSTSCSPTTTTITSPSSIRSWRVIPARRC